MIEKNDQLVSRNIRPLISANNNKMKLVSFFVRINIDAKRFVVCFARDSAQNSATPEQNLHLKSASLFSLSIFNFLSSNKKSNDYFLRNYKINLFERGIVRIRGKYFARSRGNDWH